MGSIITQGGGASLYGSRGDLLAGAILVLRNQFQVEAGTGKINQWTDESGFGHHAVQIPGTPRAVKGGNNPWGNVAVSFDGTQGLYVPTFNIPAGCKDITVFFAGKATTNTIIMELSVNAQNAQNAFWITPAAVRLKGNVAENYQVAATASTWTAIRAELFKSKSVREVSGYINSTLSTGPVVDAGDNTNEFATNLPLYLGCRAGTSLFLSGSLSSIIIFPFKVEGARALAIENSIIRPI